ncbi:MAG: response regulator [Spirochaeta sp.]|nr:response regulator [Spirochaeta sp.]
MGDERKKTILLVEDEALLAMAEKQRLEKSGYVVVHVLTGEAAVAAALNVDSRPDLVLMDSDLGGGIDGTEASRQILNEIDIPVVFLSSHTVDYLRSILKTTQDGFCVMDMNGSVVDVNDAYCEMCGYSLVSWRRGR